jgi:protein TonB
MVSLITAAPEPVPPPPLQLPPPRLPPVATATAVQPPLQIDVLTAAPTPLVAAATPAAPVLAPAAAAATPVAAPAPSEPRLPAPPVITQVAYLVPPAPMYPPLSRRLNETGLVVLRVLIDADGKPAHIDIAASSGHDRLDQAALAAVRRARFRPHSENGRPTAAMALVPVRFTLEG